MLPFKLVVFDLAGTTIVDHNEVLDALVNTVDYFKLPGDRDSLKAMAGWSKLEIFKKLCTHRFGKENPEIEAKAEMALTHFNGALKEFYHKNPPVPSEGATELFKWLKSRHIKISIVTGFPRSLTSEIFSHLGWDKGLNEHFLGDQSSVIDISICSDEVKRGKPSVELIQKSMKLAKVADVKEVIVVGDAPADLQAGKKANCLLTIGVTNGSHSRDELDEFPNDGLISSLKEFKTFVESK